MNLLGYPLSNKVAPDQPASLACGRLPTHYLSNDAPYICFHKIASTSRSALNFFGPIALVFFVLQDIQNIGQLSSINATCCSQLLSFFANETGSL